MAGRQHESRPDQETVRKGQIADESRKTETLRVSENFKCSPDTQDAYSGNPPHDLKIDKTKNINVRFYMLSVMNEANKVISLLQYFVLIYNNF